MYMGKIYSMKYFCNARVGRLGKILSSKNFGCKVFSHNPLYMYKSWSASLPQLGKQNLGR